MRQSFFIFESTESQPDKVIAFKTIRIVNTTNLLVENKNKLCSNAATLIKY